MQPEERAGRTGKNGGRGRRCGGAGAGPAIGWTLPLQNSACDQDTHPATRSFLAQPHTVHLLNPRLPTSYSALSLVGVWRGRVEIYTGAMYGSNFIMNQAQAHASGRVWGSRKARSRYQDWRGRTSHLPHPSYAPYAVYAPVAPTSSSPAPPSARPRGQSVRPKRYCAYKQTLEPVPSVHSSGATAAAWLSLREHKCQHPRDEWIESLQEAVGYGI
ncbi:hypothetical protein FIBSPDRAFT_940190, partial [Athelia psychrophila]